jgi:GTP 3',8-cyclase
MYARMLGGMESQGFGSVLLPQFRVTVNSRCGRNCFFCRPSGEGVPTPPNVDLPVDDLVQVAGVVRDFGIDSVKLTGGDPALYPALEPAVNDLRGVAGFKEVEVISRHPAIGRRAVRLAEAGVTQFNISLDTLDPRLHYDITGQNDHVAVLDALRSVIATGVPVKVNMVVMSGVNDAEVGALAAWCEAEGVHTLKLLDVIKDLDAGAESLAKKLARQRGKVVSDLYVPLGAVTSQVSMAAARVTIRTQGGLGHPMTVLTMASGFEIVLKDSSAGAWYGDICEGCPLFPCHDALMALRLTADLRLQFCLLRDDIVVDLTPALRSAGDLRSIIGRALDTYAGAKFRQGMPLAEVMSS